MRNFLVGIAVSLALTIGVASAAAAVGKAPLRLIEGRAAYEAFSHFHGNDFGPDYERILPVRDKAA